MTHWENLSTQVEEDGQRAQFDEGLLEGYALPAYPLPAIASKPLYMLTVRERGVVYGRLVRMDEMMGER